MQTNSAQSCGCDPGWFNVLTGKRGWLCERHLGSSTPFQLASHVVSAVVPRTAPPSSATFIGPGGAPTRATTLPTDPKLRKQYPIAAGVLRYFPDAIVALAHLSWKGNEQHNPGKPLHWDRSKSGDEEDTMLRHFLEAGTLDKDGIRHSAKAAWRALAILQKEIEAESATSEQ